MPDIWPQNPKTENKMQIIKTRPKAWYLASKPKNKTENKSSKLIFLQIYICAPPLCALVLVLFFAQILIDAQNQAKINMRKNSTDKRYYCYDYITFMNILVSF